MQENSDANLEIFNNYEVANIFESNYFNNLKDRFFSAEMNLIDNMLQVTITLKNQDESFFYPVTARMNINGQEITVENARQLLIEFIDAYFEEFFREGEQVYLPIEWGAFELNGYALQAKGQILNNKLERLADEWLKKAEDSAVILSEREGPVQ
ncbi:MAG: hypothetical protein KBD78_12090 [Oligoflexales bacterium]|nr:hypothetical protein [Oligoflexales bacterium]